MTSQNTDLTMVKKLEPEVITDLQQTVSASRLSLFLQCRLKFYLRYVVKVNKPKTPSLHLGNTVHSVLKSWNKARWLDHPLSLKALHEVLLKEWTEQKTRDPVEWEDDEEEAEKLTAWRLCDLYLRDCGFPSSIKPDAVEVPMEMDLHHHGLPRLIGIIDLVQQQRIIDFKTSATTPNAEKVAHTHETQTSIYAMLYREANGHHESGLELHHLVKLKNPKLCITQLPPMKQPQQTRLFRLLESYVDGLDRRDFIPSPGMACASCEFFNECRTWH